ncbi:MAG TPA: CBS domain-containing protein [Bradyrhizobium sp.]|nr:CBS domain-containing protein [Bradyrhizobium sp.]
MRAQDIMSRHVITTTADTSMIDAIKIMLSNHISGLPVIDLRGKLIGILSEGDFIRRVEVGTSGKRGRWLALLADPEQAARDFVRQHGRKVGEIMSPNPFTITEETPIEQIVRLMESHNIKRLPVMRGDDIVGMVTHTDFMIAIASLSRKIQNRSDTDDRIRSSVVEALSREPWRPRALNVSVNDGVVTLKGTVRSEGVRKAAIVATENIAGVKRVDDQLSNVSHPAPEDEYGGGDFVSLQEEPSTADDTPL